MSAQTQAPPRLSIVLVTKNRASILQRSLRSILREQETDYGSVEVIVIDGGSTDETVDILRQNAGRLAYWVSEPDSGVAEATNKGLALARAEVIRLVGDDDEFVPGRLNEMMTFLERHPEYDIVAGHNEVCYEEPDGTKRFILQEKFVGEIPPSELYKWGHPKCLIPEVCFFRRRVFDKLGVFDRSLKWFGFLDFFLRAANAGLRIYVVPCVILRTYQTVWSDSRQHSVNPAFRSEYLSVIENSAGLWWRCWHYFGGTMNPGALALRPVRRLCARIRFHPRKALRAAGSHVLRSLGLKRTRY